MATSMVQPVNTSVLVGAAPGTASVPYPHSILHLHPALALVTPMPRVRCEYVEIQGISFWVFRGCNVYLNSETKQVTYKLTEGADYYFLEFSPGVITAVCSSSRDARDEAGTVIGSDAAMALKMTRVQEWGAGAGTTMLEQIPGWVTRTREVLADPAEYTRRESARIAAERADRQTVRAREEAERLALAETRRLKCIAVNTESFRAGREIEWDGFETLCKIHGVEMHIRTIGTGRRRVPTVGAKCLSVRGKGRAGSLDGVWAAVRELTAALEKAVASADCGPDGEPEDAKAAVRAEAAVSV